MANKARDKGIRLEQPICDWLSNWYANDPNNKVDYFIRDPSSGASATKQRDKVLAFNFGDPTTGKKKDLDLLRNTNAYAIADIFPVKPEVYDFSMRIAVEAKNYEEVPWGRILFQPHETNSSTNVVLQHWTHLCGLCTAYRRVPLLVYKETRIREQSPVILMPDDLLSRYPSGDKLLSHMVAHFPQMSIQVFRFFDFLRIMSYKEFVNTKILDTYLKDRVFLPYTDRRIT